MALAVLLWADDRGAGFLEREALHACARELGEVVSHADRQMAGLAAYAQLDRLPAATPLRLRADLAAPVREAAALGQRDLRTVREQCTGNPIFGWHPTTARARRAVLAYGGAATAYLARVGADAGSRGELQQREKARQAAAVRLREALGDDGATLLATGSALQATRQ